jgi:hypothetical protein
MSADRFDQAAQRHYADAERLAADGRYDGAGHLMGFAAECAIKHALPSGQGVPLKHLPELVEAAKKVFHGLKHRALYQLLAQPEFMSGWRIDDRYAADGSVTAAQYDRWRKSTQRALGAAALRRTSPHV